MPKGYWRQPGRNWTRVDELFLAAWWGLKPDAWVAAHIPSGPRTVDACKIRATRRLRQARSDNLLNARDVGRIFGVDPTTPVRTWLPRGWVTAQRSSIGAGGNGRMWRFGQASLEQFIRQRPWCVEPARMQRGHWLTAIAQEVHQTDPWVTVDEAAVRLFYHPHILAKWIHQLRFPHERAPKLGKRAGPWQGRIVLRAASLPLLAQLIEQQTHEHRSAGARRRVLRDGLPNGRPVRAQPAIAFLEAAG